MSRSADPTSSDAEAQPVPILVARGGLAGVLMGLANLVPGISGGTMLLAAGVYPAFISAIAELTTFRLRLRPIVLVGTIATAAALAILLLAGTMKTLVVEQRWVMYSIFIGLTLGGVPLVWRLARPLTPGVALGALGAFALMVLMQLAGGASGSSENLLLLFLSGLAGASAMILPGVSGGYLLLLLGQYEPILSAIDQVKQALLAGGGPDVGLLMSAMTVVVPVGIGVLVGIVGVSNLIRWLLHHYAKPTLGALLGLLLGAVVGLWPFQQPIEPKPGDLIDGRVVSAQNLAEVDIEDWPVQYFDPRIGQVASCLALIGTGFAATLLIARLDPERD